MPTDNNRESWLSSWPDAAGFAIGLAVARLSGWKAGDLIWSLWLSSLVVGYATIVWMIAQPAASMASAVWRGRDDAPAISVVPVISMILLGALAILGFFTFHFGFFHYVHSQFLMSFFPIDPANGWGHATRADMSTYREVVRRYWTFLPAAFLAHRAVFLRKPLSFDGGPSALLRARGASGGPSFMEPYRNVARMHLLIFFFFFAHFAGLENFAVYAMIYAVYFFPWRLVRRAPTVDALAGA